MFNSQSVRRAASVAIVLASCLASSAGAVGVSGQGTWEATLQARDLNGDGAPDAYYDTDLDITWLADAGYVQTSGYRPDPVYFGLVDWYEAETWVTSLNVGGVSGWRLPDVHPVNGSSFSFSYNGSADYGYNITRLQSELSHLYYVTLGNKSYYDTSGNYQPGYGLTNTGPFSSVLYYGYWSNGELGANDPAQAWTFDTFFGEQYAYRKGNLFNAWAVHSGDVGTPVVPEPSTYAMFFAGLAGLGYAARRNKKAAH